MANPACAFIAFVANRAWARLIVYLDEASIATVLWIIVAVPAKPEPLRVPIAKCRLRPAPAIQVRWPQS
jgi:hypothetical protein